MILASKNFWICIAVVAVGAYLVHWGDRHGFSAAKLRKIERELAAVNQRVAEFNLRDDQAAIDADLLRSEGYQRALAELGKGDTCLVTPAMARAFERIGP